MKYLTVLPLCISLSTSLALAGCTAVRDEFSGRQKEAPVAQIKRHKMASMLESSQYSTIAMPLPSPQPFPLPLLKPNTEKYQSLAAHLPIDPAITPLSTFSTDVDTASFSNVRRFISRGVLPPVGAVRTEEIVNYFDYHYAAPTQANQTVKLAYELSNSPWNPKAKLLKVSLQAKKYQNNKGSNLVFLIDVSGSMSSKNKLPLLKKSLNLLTKGLKSQDCIAIVAYAGNANVVLNATSGTAKQKIRQAINDLRAGGSTNGGDGLNIAYQLASANFIKGGVNRILLATDGDFNVGMSNPSEMKKYIEKQRKTGINLSVLGFGEGNYNDHLMEELSNAGNGNAAYIDTLQEAQKVLVDQISATLRTVAYDAKIQLEFNPQVVASYRLLGYENRALADSDFINDSKDAGEIGAGQSVTALYEIFYNGEESAIALRYQKNSSRKLDRTAELGFIKIRYKLGHNLPSKQYSLAIQQPDFVELGQSSDSFRFAAAAAAYAEKLRNSEYLQNFKWSQIIALASSAKGADQYGYRSSFIQQLRLSENID